MPTAYTSQAELARRQKLMEAMQGRNTTGQGIGGGLANMLRGYRSGKENRAITDALAKNESIDNSERQMIVNQLKNGAQNAAPGVLKPGESYNFQGKYKEFPLQQALSQQSAQQAAEAEAAKPYTLAPLNQRIQNGQVVAENTNQRSPLVSMPGPESSANSAYGKGIGDRATERLSSAQSARTQNAQYEKMLESLDAGMSTGLGQSQLVDLKNIGQSLFGLELDESVGEQELLTAFGNQLAMQMRNPASGMGLTGSTSNKDLDFLKGSVAGLSKTPEGNRLIIGMAMKMNDFKLAMADEQQRIIAANGGQVPNNLDTELMRFADNYQIFTPQEKQEISMATGEDSDGWGIVQ